MSKPYHFYVVFNPMINGDSLYKTQAHEFYQALKTKVLTQDSSEGYMYWGKLKVDNSKSEGLESFSEAIASNKELGEETHLYITDYHHFWVAKVESVHSEICDTNHVLAFYDQKQVEMWFKITDMELLSAEFEESSYYLSQLYIDNKYNREIVNSLNPYLGGLKFPLILQDNLNEKYFKNIYSEDINRCVKNNPLINSPSASGGITTSMKSFVLPPQVFSMLSSLTKRELLDVEVRLAKREESDLNIFESVLGSYLRILESVMNDTLGVILKKEFGNCLFISERGDHFSDQKTTENMVIEKFQGVISLKAFVDLLGDANKFGNLSLTDIESKYPTMVDFFSKELIAFIEKEELVSIRQLSTSSEVLNISKVKALKVRNQILGVGCVGFINKLFSFVLEYENEYLYSNVS